MAKFTLRRSRKRDDGISASGNEPLGLDPIGSNDSDSGGIGDSLTDPERAAAAADGSAGNGGDGTGDAKPRKRGWPAGKPRGKRGEGASASRSAASLAGIESTLLSLHTMAAAISKSPHWELTEKEARGLAEGIARVSEHYEFPMLSPGHQAIAALMITAFAVYAPRIGRSVLKPAKKPEPQADVVEPARVYPGILEMAGAA